MTQHEITIQPGLLFSQAYYVIGGIFLMAIGVAILYSLVQWWLRARRLEGTIIGVRRRQGVFHTVYSYTTPDGQQREATSLQGSGSLAGRSTGRHTNILVMDARPDEAREARSPLVWGLGLAFLICGAWLAAYAVSVGPGAAFTGVAVVLLLIFLGFKVWRRLSPYLAAARAQAAAGQSWNATPIESAESIGPQERSRTTLRIGGSKPERAGAIFLIMGFVILATTYLPVHQLLELRKGVRTQGVVQKLNQKISTSNKPDYNLFPVVEYTAEDGTPVSFTDRSGANPSPYRVGDEVTVLYQPGRQGTAMIDRGWRNWEPVAALLVLGLLFITLGNIALRARKRP